MTKRPYLGKRELRPTMSAILPPPNLLSLDVKMPSLTRLMTPLSLAVLAFAATAAGCGGELKSLAEATGSATTTQEPRTFVVEARRADTDYIPVGRKFAQPTLCKTANSPPPPPTAVRGKGAVFVLNQPAATDGCKTAAQFKTIEAELEAKRISNEAAGNQARAMGTLLPPPAPSRAQPTN